jgi:hypothetical protein
VRAGAELWRREPSSFAAVLAEPDPLSGAANAALANLSANELTQGIMRVPAVAPEIVKRRGDLLASDGFRAVPGLDVEQIVAWSADRFGRNRFSAHDVGRAGSAVRSKALSTTANHSRVGEQRKPCRS